MATETRLPDWQTGLCGAQTLLGYACPGHAMMTLDGRPLCFWHAARASTGPQAHWVGPFDELRAGATTRQQKEARP